MQILPTEALDWVYSKELNPGNYFNDSPIVVSWKLIFITLMNCMIYIMIFFFLAGEKIKVAEEMLFEYKLQMIEDNYFSLGKNLFLSRQ